MEKEKEKEKEKERLKVLETERGLVQMLEVHYLLDI
jgi:hypothetical protein